MLTKDVKQWELLYITGGMQTGAATLDDSLMFSYKINIILPYNLAITSFGIYRDDLKTYVHENPSQGFIYQLYS